MLSSVAAALAFQALPALDDCKLLRSATAAALLSSCVAAPAFAGNQVSGESIFSGNCAACHAGGMNVVYGDKSLQQEALEKYLDGGANVSLEALPTHCPNHPHPSLYYISI